MAAHQIAEPAGGGKKPQPLPAEQLHRQDNGGRRAVDHTAEQGNQAKRRCKSGIKSQQGPHRAAKCSADKESRYDLAALEARADGHRRQQDLRQERPGDRLPGYGLYSNPHARSVVVPAQQEGQDNQQNAARYDADIGIFKAAVKLVGRKMDHG